MKKRKPGVVLLLPFVTLGIYCIYWLYATRKELLARHGQSPNGIPPVSILFLPMIVLIALAFTSFMITAGSGNMTAENIITVIVIIGGIAALLVVPLLWFWRYCHVASEVTKTMDFAQMYVLYVVLIWLCSLAPVWMLIMQIEFNKLADHDAGHLHHPHDPQHPHTPHTAAPEHQA